MQIELILDESVTVEYKQAIASLAEQHGCSLSTEQVERIAPAISAMAKRYPLPVDNMSSLVLALLEQIGESTSVTAEYLALSAIQTLWIKESTRLEGDRTP